MDPMQQYLQEALPRGYIAAFRILGNPEESRDACQEAAVRAIAAKERYDSSQPFYPWFYRILKNYCFDLLKQRGRTESESTSEPIALESSAENKLMVHEQSDAVNKAIKRLPDDLREMIELRHFQDLSYEEMAEILECPVGTVMSRLYRARKTLRKALLEEPYFHFESSDEVTP